MAIVQRVCTPYRVGLFERISDVPGVRVRVFHGMDVPGTKVRNAADLGRLDRVQLPTSILRGGRRHLVWHRGLVRALDAFGPDVILSEGESNFPNYLQVLHYRRQRPSVEAVHWSLGGLPGRPARAGLGGAVRHRLQEQFDRFLVYSSFGRDRMVAQGHDPARVSVAVNTCDTGLHLEASRTFAPSRADARTRLGLPDRFTVLYCGAFDAAKRPDLLLDLAGDPALADVHFVGVGDGPLRAELSDAARRRGLDTLHLPGRVGAELPAYYRASDVLLVPGRGGMVISEAMAWSLPVLVHQADGTEYDLIEQEATGVRVESPEAFPTWIRRLADDPGRAEAWGRRGRQRLEDHFTTEAMVSSILRVVRGG